MYARPRRSTLILTRCPFTALFRSLQWLREFVQVKNTRLELGQRQSFCNALRTASTRTRWWPSGLTASIADTGYPTTRVLDFRYAFVTCVLKSIYQIKALWLLPSFRNRIIFSHVHKSGAAWLQHGLWWLRPQALSCYCYHLVILHHKPIA